MEDIKCEGEVMTDETYQSWSNRETWNVALLIDNTEGLLSGMLEVLNQNYEHACCRLDAVQEYVETLAHADLGEAYHNSYLIALDLITCALARVDWRELTDHFLEGFGD